MNLSAKWTTVVFSLLFIGLSIICIIETTGFPPSAEGTLGPAYLPRILCILLVLFASISILTTWARQDSKITIQYARFLLIFAVLVAAYALAAEYMNYYIVVSLFFFLSFVALNRQEKLRMALLKAVLATAVLSGLVYLAFRVVLKVF